MPFQWTYGGPSWATPSYDATADPVRSALGIDRLVVAGADSESTGTYHGLRALPGLDGQPQRHAS